MSQPLRPPIEKGLEWLRKPTVVSLVLGFAASLLVMGLRSAGVLEFVELAAYDVAGRRVATVAQGSWPAGRHTMSWTPRGSNGTTLASGVYLLRLEADGVESVRRIVVTR